MKPYFLISSSCLMLIACTTPNQDLSLATRDFLCEKYEYWDGGKLSKPYLNELKRRGVSCDGYNRQADKTIVVQNN